MSYCIVRNCRYPDSHIAEAHICGNCQNIGHGDAECKAVWWMEFLSKKMKTSIKSLPKHLSCDVKDCCTYWQHKSESHHCKKCGERHSESKCDGRKYEIKCPLCKKENNVVMKNDKIYGVSEACDVCMVNVKDVLLPECKHVCVCSECVKKMDTSVALEIHD